MKVKNIIEKRLLTIDKDQTVATAVKKMEKNRISRLVVVDKNQLVGMITLSDVADRLGSVKTSTVPTSGLHVSGVMSSKPITIQLDMDITKAAEIVVQTGYSGFPVVNKKNELVGILTKKDFIRRFLKFDEHKVKDLMTKNPDFVSTSTRLIEARDKLLKMNISVLPVYEEGAVVGLISKKLIAIALAVFRDEVPGKRISERIRTLQVGDHMFNNPPTITSGKSLSDAAQHLVKEYIHALPVVNRKGNLIAILTRGIL
jgi:CBS domain-containing protein